MWIPHESLLSFSNWSKRARFSVNFLAVLEIVSWRSFASNGEIMSFFYQARNYLTSRSTTRKTACATSPEPDRESSWTSDRPFWTLDTECLSHTPTSWRSKRTHPTGEFTVCTMHSAFVISNFTFAASFGIWWEHGRRSTLATGKMFFLTTSSGA